MDQNRTTYLIVGGTLGAATGWFVGAVIAEVLNQREAIANQPDEPLDREDYRDIPDIEDVEEEDPGDDDDDQDEITSPTESIKKMTNKRKKNYGEYFQDRPELAALVRKYNQGVVEEEPVEETEDVSEEDEEWEDDDFETIEDEVDDVVDPRVISEEEFRSDTEHAHVTLLYFDDDVLTTPDRQPINKPERILGEEALFSFGELSDDENRVYVINREKKAAYEVVRMNVEFAPAIPRKRVDEYNETGDDQ